MVLHNRGEVRAEAEEKVVGLNITLLHDRLHILPLKYLDYERL